MSRASARAEGGPAVAHRPATVEWAAAETIVAIGGRPVATASPYRGQDGATTALAGVPEVGSFFTPDPEYLLAQKPDLIFCASWQRSLVPMLAHIAPVHVFDLQDPQFGLLENAVRLTRTVGGLIGRAREGEIYLRVADTALDDLKVRLQPVAGRPVLLGALEADGRHIIVFGAGNLFDSVLLRLGLRNAWRGTMPAWGSARLGIEVLADYPDTPILYLDAGAPTAAARQALSASSLWNALPSVRQGKVLPLPFAWMYGGLPTVLRFGTSLAVALVPEAHHDRT